MSQSPKKILILYTSHTLGHKTIAENISWYLERAGFTVRLEDILKVQSGWLVNLTRKLHRFVNVYLPFIWRWLYLSPSFTRLALPYRLKVAAKNHLQTLRLVTEYSPDVIITTQTTASAVVAFLKQQGLYKGKFGIAFSDFHLHRFWLYDQADFYLANIEEQKKEMLRLGVPEKNIFVCGFILPPRPTVEPDAARAKFGIRPHERVVLVGSGSLGLGIDLDFLNDFLNHQDTKVIVVCGKNQDLFESLSAEFAGTNIITLGFYTPMSDIYAIADVFLSKPGGLSVAEALSWRLPILVSYLLPGQEELNYNYLLDRGLIMPEPIALAGEVSEELSSGSFRQALLTNPEVERLFPSAEVLSGAVTDVLQRV